MKRAAASRYLILAVFAWAVLFLPWGNLAAAAVQPAGCPYCHTLGPGLVSGHCCCPAESPTPCGACSHSGSSICHCSSGTLAFISPTIAGTPTWHMAPYVPSVAAVPVKIFPPHIFHPPEQRHLSFQT